MNERTLPPENVYFFLLDKIKDFGGKIEKFLFFKLSVVIPNISEIKMMKGIQISS